MLSAHSRDPPSLMGRGTVLPPHRTCLFHPHTLTTIDPRVTRPWSYSGPLSGGVGGGGSLVLSALKYVARC